MRGEHAFRVRGRRCRSRARVALVAGAELVVACLVDVTNPPTRVAGVRSSSRALVDATHPRHANALSLARVGHRFVRARSPSSHRSASGVRVRVLAVRALNGRRSFSA